MRQRDAEINAFIYPWVIGIPILVAYHQQSPQPEPARPAVKFSDEAMAAAAAATGYDDRSITPTVTVKDRPATASMSMQDYRKYYAAHKPQRTVLVR